MSTLEDRVLAIEQHLGLNVVNAVFTEPTDTGAVVTYFDTVVDSQVIITRVADGRWVSGGGRFGYLWKTWVSDARPGTIRRVS